MRQRLSFFNGLQAIGCALLIAVATASPTPAWQVHGVPVSSAPLDQFSPVLATDGARGAIVVWWEDRSGIGVYAQRVDSTGTARWTPNGVTVCNVAGVQYVPHAISDAAGGAFVTWGDSRSGEYDVYAQRIDSNGALLWDAGGLPLCTAPGPQSFVPLVADRTNALTQLPGAIVTWGDPRNSTSDYNIYVQHVNANGGDLWAANGIALCTATGNQNGPAIATDGAGGLFAQHGAIVAWTDSRNGNADVYARRVNAAGNPLWSNDGVPVCVLPGAQLAPEIIYVGSVVVIVWQDADRNGLYAQKLDLNGNALWTANGILVTNSPSDEMLFAVAGNGAGGAIVAWEDGRNDGSDVYAQLLDANGAPQWEAGGVPLVMAPSTQLEPSIVPDNSGGAIVAWVDWRSGFGSAIYAQRVNSTGQIVWPTNGVRLSDVSSCHQVQSVSNGSNQAIVAWEDQRNGNSDIYANRVLDLTSVDSPASIDRRFRVAFRSQNPSRGGVSLGLELPRASSVLAEIFDPRGSRVRVLAGPKLFQAGNHVLIWDGKDDAGLAARSGVYFLRVRAGEQSRTVKLVELH